MLTELCHPSNWMPITQRLNSPLVDYRYAAVRSSYRYQTRSSLSMNIFIQPNNSTNYFNIFFGFSLVMLAYYEWKVLLKYPLCHSIFIFFFLKSAMNLPSQLLFLFCVRPRFCNFVVNAPNPRIDVFLACFISQFVSCLLHLVLCPVG